VLKWGYPATIQLSLTEKRSPAAGPVAREIFFGRDEFLQILAMESGYFNYRKVVIC
jgi:hypothetical protein